MNIVLWIVQVLLAFAFIAVGSMKTFTPLDKLAKTLPWTKEFPVALVRFIGISELLGGIGLVLPPLVKILPWLAIVAAIGLGIIMVGAVLHHIVRKEYAQIAPSFVLLLLTLFVAIGRLVLVGF